MGDPNDEGPQWLRNMEGGSEGGMWTGVVDLSRSPSPMQPTKRVKILEQHDDGGAHVADSPTVGLMGSMRGVSQYAASYHEGVPPELSGYMPVSSLDFQGTLADGPGREQQQQRRQLVRRPVMQTGCVPCLIKGIPCDPMNPNCRLAISDEWHLNNIDPDSDEYGANSFTSLTLFRPDTQWRRNWRERHSLNFFVNFSAPQMAGFFDSSFWQRMVIQTSYYEPAILHAITAIGALHECIMQRAFTDDKRGARAIAFALDQCNKAISCLTNSQMSNAMIGFPESTGARISNSKIALITCVLFTCFEAMQGRCDSAVNHALQGRRLLQATGQLDMATIAPNEDDELDHMRPIVERLEVQATALLDKGRRPDQDSSDQAPPLPPLECIHSLDHAHTSLHTALNSVMRFMQSFNSLAPPAYTQSLMREKEARYGPWFTRWEAAFTDWLTEHHDEMADKDLKRAMVLKANHLVGSMLSSVDQAAGPMAYDQYEAEFRAIVDLSREVLASFSCPPLPTLTGGSAGVPYLSFSLWVTDPLWMAISRCRNPSVRQAAFTLLSQNPRQEGIWHAGPQLTAKDVKRESAPAKTAVKTEPSASAVDADAAADAHSTAAASSSKRARTYSNRNPELQQTAS